MTFTRHEPPYISDAQIIAFADGVETPHSATLLKTSFNPNEYGKYALPTGLWVAETANNRHLLKRANVTEAFATTTGKLDLWQLFSPGDVLKIVEPYLKLTITTLTTGATVTIAAGNYSDVFTFAGTNGNTPGDAAEEMATFINVTSPVLSDRLRAIADGADVHLFSLDGYTAYTISITTAGTIALDPGDGIMTVNTEIGTIQAVDNTASNAGEVTLTGSATTPVPVGAKVGIPCARVLGFINCSLNMDYKDRQHVALVSGASGIREGLLPYVDGDIKRQLPKLRITRRF